MLPPLKDYQLKAIDYALKHPYAILALGAGLGKTRSAIEIAQRLNEKAMIVLPAYQILNWESELNKWANKDKTVLAIRKSKDIGKYSGQDFVLISYDIAKNAEHLFEKIKLVFLDEAHNIKSMKAKRTEYIHRVIYENSVPRVYPMSGTPIKNRVEEWYSLISLMNYCPKIKDSKFLDKFPDSITFADHFSFRHEFDMEIGVGRFVKIVKWSGLKNKEELKSWLKDIYIRIPSSVLGLEEPIYEDLIVSEADDKDLLNAFNSMFEKDGSGDVDSRAKANAAIAKVPFTIKKAEAILEECDSVVIYSDHVEPSEMIAKHFNTTALNGNVPASKRMELAHKWQGGEGKVLVATIKALSESVTLTRTNRMVLNDFPWVPGDLEQVMRRINRLGQSKQCIYYRIVGSPQDYKIIEAIQSKIKVIAEAT